MLKFPRGIMKNLDVFLIFLAIRLASVFLVQTFFVPDEYWQSLEVAHKFAFGYGHLTWEWIFGIRSYVYPLAIAAYYKILDVLTLDTASAVIYGPRIFQALLSAYSDVCFYKWSGTKKWAVFSIASAWFWFYTGSRTLTNSLECALSTIALSKFPWPGKGNEENSTFIWIIATLFVIRPTCVAIWIPICVFHLAFSKRPIIDLIIKDYVPIGLSVLALSVLIDSLGHGAFIVTVYEFFKFNVYQNVASFYGEQPWHWYLSNGFPAILGIHILPFVMAVLVVIKNRRNHLNELVMLSTIVFAIFIYSFLPHKEFRFLLPLLPLALYVSSRFLSAWSKKARMFNIWLVTAIIFIGNAVPAWYMSYAHQRGTLDVMDKLRGIAMDEPQNVSFLFLMPCHSTPFYSHLHVNVSARFLTCLPNFHNISGYVDEADSFYENPMAWLRNNYPPRGVLPTHIICFDTLLPLIRDILSSYKQVSKIFHCNMPLSSRIGRYVIVNELLDFQ